MDGCLVGRCVGYWLVEWRESGVTSRQTVSQTENDAHQGQCMPPLDRHIMKIRQLLFLPSRHLVPGPWMRVCRGVCVCVCVCIPYTCRRTHIHTCPCIPGRHSNRQAARHQAFVRSSSVRFSRSLRLPVRRCGALIGVCVWGDVVYVYVCVPFVVCCVMCTGTYIYVCVCVCVCDIDDDCIACLCSVP